MVTVGRRRILGAIAATSVAGLSAPAVAQSRVRLAASTPWPVAATGPGALAPRLARRLDQLSNGQVQLETSLRNASTVDTYAAVGRGDVAVCFGQEEDWIDLSPAYSLFCSTPFGMTADEFEGWIYFGDGANVWDRLAAENGVKPMLAGDLGLVPTMINADVAELASLTGLTAVATGLAARFWQTMGVKVSTQSGVVIDDPVLGGFAAARNGLRLLSPSMSRPHHALSANFNLSVFDALSDEHKSLIKLAVRSEHVAQRVDAENAKRQFAAAPTVKVSPLISTQMALATKEVMLSLETGGPAASDALWSHQLHSEDAYAWTELGEGAYLAKRVASEG